MRPKAARNIKHKQSPCAGGRSPPRYGFGRPRATSPCQQNARCLISSLDSSTVATASILPKPCPLRFSQRRSHALSDSFAVRLRCLPAGNRRVRCGLINPDGGKLVHLVASAGAERDALRREAARATGLPRFKLSRIDLEWVHVLNEGWESPLRGFMREAEFLQTLRFNCLRMPDGSIVNMSVAIVLAIDDSQKRSIEGRGRVVLLDAGDKPVAILKENLAKMRENLPDGFMCPGGWKVLVEYYNSIAPRAILEEHATA
ncbi:hypothetical protein KSP40_PGU022397 [Platanthera guangdongensis]|uniref:ATP-sulfurylase PUA-like domain-containing protein n=1 Tax=Platanthera guangdongensis TaxID=2320717 RepID=A0ABR2LM62_9ASPA